MRKLTGVGTPRQAAARFWTWFTALMDLLSAWMAARAGNTAIREHFPAPCA